MLPHMPATYERLLARAKEKGIVLELTQPGATADRHWHLSAQLDDPVTFRASRTSSSIDDAAAKVVEQLQTVAETIE